MTITGPGANVIIVRRSAAQGTPDFRVFNITNGVTVAVSGLTIAGGIYNEQGENGAALTQPLRNIETPSSPTTPARRWRI